MTNEYPIDTAKVALDSIVVGPRLRKTLGDLTELRISIRRHGVLEPILVRSQQDPDALKPVHHLVAGMRRLTVARALGHDAIPARDLGPLTDDEAREVEREENAGRRDFTTYEASKKRLKELRAAAEEVQREKIAAPPPPVVTKSGRTRVRSSKATKAEVAERTGVSPAAQTRIERHTRMVDKHPALAAWTRGEVLAFEDGLAGLPASVVAGIKPLVGQPDPDAAAVTKVVTTVRALSPAAREQLLALAPEEITRACKYAPPADPACLRTLAAVLAMLDGAKKDAAKLKGRGIVERIDRAIGPLQNALTDVEAARDEAVRAWCEGRKS